MTREQKIDRLRRRMEDGDPDEIIEPDILGDYLDDAEALIMSKLYPFEGQAEGKEMPERYDGLQLRICVYWLNKRGAEGEIQHIENGIHRNYGSSDVPEQMLKEIMPHARVIV